MTPQPTNRPNIYAYLGQLIEVTQTPQFILIKARNISGDLVKLKFIGYSKAESIKLFHERMNDINNFR